MTPLPTLLEPRSRGLLALIAAASLGGCAAPDGDEPELTTVAAVFPTGCATATPHQTATSPRFRVTAATYTATGCENAYVLDMDNQGAPPYGIAIAYDEAEPTTRSSCLNARLTVGLWERISTTNRPALGEVVKHGIWYPDPAGRFRCRTPRIVVEQTFKAWRPNRTRDWRLVIRAQQDAGTSITRKRFAVASMDTVSELQTATEDVLQNIRASVPPNVNPTYVHPLWLNKGTPSGQRLCRSSRLDLALMQFSAASLVKAGAAGADVTARNDAYADMITAFCTTAGTELNLQAAALAFGDASIRVRDSIAREYASQAGTLGLGDRGFAINLIDQTMELDLGRIARNCEVSPESMYRYLTAGTLPSGVTAELLLFGSCAAPGDTPSQVGARLGVGGSRSNSSARAALRSCMTPLIDNATTNVCNDPRASDAPPAGFDDPADPFDAETTECFDADNDFAPCDDGQATTFVEPAPEVIMGNAGVEAFKADKVEENLAEATDPNRAEEQVLAEQSASDPDQNGSFWGDLFEALVKDSKKLPGANTIFTLWEHLGGPVADYYRTPGVHCLDPDSITLGEWESCVRQWNPEPRPTPTTGVPPRYCAPDFAPGGWYAAYDESLVDSRPGRQVHLDDRLDHCLCDMMEPKYFGAAGIAGVEISGMCPTEAEKIEQGCLASPFGDDDRPRPECVKHLMPASIDDTAWNARICNAVRCPENQIASLQDGACACVARPTIVGSPVQGCPTGQVAYCTPENPEACLCTPTDNGVVPFGDNPLCRYDGTRFPGSLEGWLTPSPSRVIVHRAGNENLLGFNPGSSGQVSAVTPMHYPVNFASTGTIIRPRTMISKAPAAGQNLDLQLYCTNLENNLIHGAMGQCRLNSQTPGVVTSCDITTNSSIRNACYNGPFTMEWNVQAPSSYSGYVFVGKFDFAGTLTAVPSPAPICPVPQVQSIIPLPRPLWESLGGTPENLDRDFTLFNGSTIRVPTTIWSLPR